MSTCTSFDAVSITVAYDWYVPARRTYCVRVWIMPDYSVIAADLPGCGSQGDSIEECLANIREAFQGCVLSYRDAGQAIPWEDGGPKPLFYEERVLAIEEPEG